MAVAKICAGLRDFGVDAFVHYGLTMGDGSVLDAFLMKGEEPRPGAVWRGNPARQVIT